MRSGWPVKEARNYVANVARGGPHYPRRPIVRVPFRMSRARESAPAAVGRTLRGFPENAAFARPLTYGRRREELAANGVMLGG